MFLPILEEDKLVGITVSDIAYSDMDIDNMILSKAGTSYKNIVETIDGEMIVGDLDGEFEEGHVLIAAANPDMMEGYIEPQDMVILGNRYESQLCAIEMDAQCIVVCMGATVSKTIRKMAKEHGCRIIVSPYDTYTVARLINHSMPVRYFMTTENLIDSIQQIMR
ncbi:MAG: DRTGG domain-containing protein [Eubacterium sp.]